MDTAIYNEPWKLKLHEMINQARAQSMWLWCRYQDLWFSPDELESAHRSGRFMWGAVNWTLRHPSERLEAAELRLKEAQAERDRIAASF